MGVKRASKWVKIRTSKRLIDQMEDAYASDEGEVVKEKRGILQVCPQGKGLAKEERRC